MEHLHSGHKKTSAFQGGQLEAAGGQRKTILQRATPSRSDHYRLAGFLMTDSKPPALPH